MLEERATALLGILLVLLAGIWAASYQPFVFPNADYHSFERIATSFASGELPNQLKRGPILPALIALLAPLMPGRHPQLHAALVLNLAFSLATVALVFRLVARTSGPAAAGLAALLVGTSSVHQGMALQPLVEPSLGFFVVLSFALLQARSRWQYAAAAAAALSRPEGLGLVGILALVNAIFEPAARRRHLALGAAALLPAIVWNGLGAMRGTGAASYVEIMDAAGRLAPRFLLYYWTELFAGFVRHRLADLAIGIMLVGIPVLLGIRVGLARFPREAIAALAWLAIGAAAVVVLGIDKARYLHPTQWVPIVFFAGGLVEALRKLARQPAVEKRAALLTAGALVVCVVGVVAGVRSSPSRGAAAVLLAELGIAAACLARARVGSGAAQPTSTGSGSTRWAVGLTGLALLTPLLAAAAERTASQLDHVAVHRLAAAPAARWLDANLGPDEVVVTLHASQVLWASDLAPRQVVGFGSFRADDRAALLEEMRRRGVSHAVYTWRKPARNASQRDYDRRKKVTLAALFREGSDVEGFVHLATLPPPEALPDQPPAQVYRRIE